MTKEIFLAALECPLRGWLIRHDHIESELSPGEEFRMEQGIDIGRRARKLYPGGVLVEELSSLMAGRSTERLLRDEDTEVIFEGYFRAGEYAARADILERTEKRWHMLEVKSSSKDKKEYIDDMAYTAMVMRDNGLTPARVSLVIVSKDFRLGMPKHLLFSLIDHTDEVLARSLELDKMKEDIDGMTGHRNPPKGQIKIECRKCLMVREHISGDVKNHVFDLPRLSRRKFDDLLEMGVEAIERIPEGFPLTANQQRVRDSVGSGKVFIGTNLGRELDRIVWPAFYLDFETFMTAVPVYADTAPYTQIPFQYSIHICSDTGVEDEHLEYLAEPGRDCRRELAEGLLRDLNGRDGKGSILIYTPFEKRIVRELAGRYPDMAGALHRLIERMVDLEKIIRKNFYHPAFHGSTSIKKTLPALVPEMSYEGMAIGDGSTAMAEFAFMAWGKYGDEKTEQVRKDLLAYCKLDTLAMVRLHERLMEYVGT